MNLRKINSILIFCLAVVFLSACQTVTDGEYGISTSFGKVGDKPLSAGIYANFPVLREVDIWDVKQQRRTLSLSIPSSEALIVSLKVAVLYKPLDVVHLRVNVGRDYIFKLLDPAVEDIFRDVIGKEKVAEMINNKERLTRLAKDKLVEKMKDAKIDVKEVLLIDLVLPTTFTEAIERKLEQQQKAIQKEFELQQATQDAEIRITGARGIAKSQEIIQSTLTPGYLSYLWIETLNDNPNVVYVATEANMPMFRTAKEPVKKPIRKKKAN